MSLDSDCDSVRQSESDFICQHVNQELLSKVSKAVDALAKIIGHDVVSLQDIANDDLPLKFFEVIGVLPQALSALTAMIALVCNDKSDLKASHPAISVTDAANVHDPNDPNHPMFRQLLT